MSQVGALFSSTKITYRGELEKAQSAMQQLSDLVDQVEAILIGAGNAP